MGIHIMPPLYEMVIKPKKVLQRFEYYLTGEDGYNAIGGDFWTAQSFTPQVAHLITKVKLVLHRFGDPGTLTIGIKNTDAEGLPLDDDLFSGTFDASDLTTDNSIPGTLYEISLGAGYNLEADVKYAIVARYTGHVVRNPVLWHKDGTAARYTRGIVCYSYHDNTDWFDTAYNDYMFEEWGYKI